MICSIAILRTISILFRWKPDTGDSQSHSHTLLQVPQQQDLHTLAPQEVWEDQEDQAGHLGTRQGGVLDKLLCEKQGFLSLLVAERREFSTCFCRTLWVPTLLLLFLFPSSFRFSFPSFSDSKSLLVYFFKIRYFNFFSSIAVCRVSTIYLVCWPYFWYVDHISGMLTIFKGIHYQLVLNWVWHAKCTLSSLLKLLHKSACQSALGLVC